jgi:antitoxin component YwqK of YwqJK toxin-antitoxin module
MNKVPGVLLLSLFIFISCSREKRVVEESYPDGSPKRVCIYKGRGENRQMIRETAYYSNGKLRMDGTYKNNKRDGKWTYWFENGLIWSEGFFAEGKNDSIRLINFPNGKKRYEFHYNKGVRTGKWKFYDETGRLLKEVDYSIASNDIKKDTVSEE